MMWRQRGRRDMKFKSGILLIVIFAAFYLLTDVLDELGIEENLGDIKPYTSNNICRKHLWNKLRLLNLSTTGEHKDLMQKVDCSDYRRSSRAEHYLLSNVLQSSNITHAGTITLVTQLTSERYDKLLDVMRTWKGPVSAAVYLKETGLSDFVDNICVEYVKKKWRHFQLHFVKENAVIYPVNYLRNIAMNEAQSDFIFITDVDFVPMPNAYEILQNYARRGMPHKNEVLNIAAFEYRQNTTFDMRTFPRNKEELKIKLINGSIIPFHQNSFADAYKSTDFGMWVDSTKPYLVQWKRWYEPFVVIRKDSTPQFDRRFVGRAYDKSSYAMQLHAMRFTFIVLPDVFIVHTPHSKKSADWFRKMGLYACAYKVEKSFIKMLEGKYQFHLKKEDIPQ